MRAAPPLPFPTGCLAYAMLFGWGKAAGGETPPLLQVLTTLPVGAAFGRPHGPAPTAGGNRRAFPVQLNRPLETARSAAAARNGRQFYHRPRRRCGAVSREASPVTGVRGWRLERWRSSEANPGDPLVPFPSLGKEQPTKSKTFLFNPGRRETKFPTKFFRPLLFP